MGGWISSPLVSFAMWWPSFCFLLQMPTIHIHMYVVCTCGSSIPHTGAPFPCLQPSPAKLRNFLLGGTRRNIHTSRRPLHLFFTCSSRLCSGVGHAEQAGTSASYWISVDRHLLPSLPCPLLIFLSNFLVFTPICTSSFSFCVLVDMYVYVYNVQ